MNNIEAKSSHSLVYRDRIRANLEVDPFRTSVKLLNTQLSELTNLQKVEILATCEFILSDGQLSSREEERVAAVKILVANLPHSLLTLAGFLRDSSRLNAFEIHFSIFCFIDEMYSIPLDSDSRLKLASLVEDYLFNVATDEGQAAWMAGDLLGDHFPIGDSIERLKKLAVNGRHASGRRGAVHGLSLVLSRLRSDEKRRGEISNILRRLYAEDPEASVREAASSVLKS